MNLYNAHTKMGTHDIKEKLNKLSPQILEKIYNCNRNAYVLLKTDLPRLITMLENIKSTPILGVDDLLEDNQNELLEIKLGKQQTKRRKKNG